MKQFKHEVEIQHTFFLQSFGELAHRPLLVDLTVEEQTRLKVIYGSAEGFHAVDLDSATVYDIYLPKHVSFTRSNSLLSIDKLIRISHFRLRVQLHRIAL